MASDDDAEKAETDVSATDGPGNEDAEEQGYTAAIHAISEDFRHQLMLLSDRQNSMVQSIGVILAFASILLIETVSLAHSRSDNGIILVALGFFFLCCLGCIWAILDWRNWEVYSGADQEAVLDRLENKDVFGIPEMLLQGVVRSYGVITVNNYILRTRIRNMAMLLVTGALLTILDLACDLI